MTDVARPRERGAPTPDRASRRRAVVLVVILIAIAAGGLTLVASRGELGHIADALRAGDARFILLAAVAEAGLFVAMAVAFQGAARLVSGYIPWWRLSLLSASLPFVNLFFPSGGIAGAVYETRHFERAGLRRPHAVLAVATEFILFWASFFVLFFAGLGFLATHAGLSRPQLVVVGIGLGLFVILGLITFAVLREPRWLLPLSQPYHYVRAKLSLGKHEGPTLVDEVVEAIQLLEADWKHVFVPFGASLASWVCDMTALYFVFRAFGVDLHPGVLVAGYAFSVFLGKILPIPGGLGIVDASMAATFNGLFVPLPVAIAAVLVYRFLSLWLPIVTGAFAFQKLERLPDETPPRPAADAA